MLEFVAKGAIIVACFGVAVFGGTPVIKWLLRRIDKRAAKSHPAAAPHAAPTAPDEPYGDGLPADANLGPTASDSVPGLVEAGKELSGGYWIGLLERAALFACVLAGFPAGIAVVLGVKGLGRYPDLRTPTGSKGELFIIGTFASMLWAAAFAGLAYGLVRLW